MAVLLCRGVNSRVDGHFYSGKYYWIGTALGGDATEYCECKMDSRRGWVYDWLFNALFRPNDGRGY